jgi:hypothetical protein
MLEKHGVRIAAVSYDAREKLAAFAEKYGIGYPLLSDADSAVIRRFGIFNFNMASDLRSYGVPHPVEYLVSPDRVVVRKYFVENYQHRVTGSAVAMREFGESEEDAGQVALQSGAVTVTIRPAAESVFAGQEVSYEAEFEVAEGWHVYGKGSGEGYTATEITFHDPRVVRQSVEMPEAMEKEMPGKDERVRMYGGSFRAVGSLLLKFPLAEGRIELQGRVRLQQCSEQVCEPPEEIPFALGLTLERFLMA